MSAAPTTLYQIENELIFLLDTLEGLSEEETAISAELEEQIARLIAAEITKVDGISRMLAHFENQAALSLRPEAGQFNSHGVMTNGQCGRAKGAVLACRHGAGQARLFVHHRDAGTGHHRA